jgi:6-phosphogluconolactonase
MVLDYANIERRDENTGFAKAKSGSSWLVYLGTKDVHATKGVYVCRFDSGTDEFHPIGRVAEIEAATWLTVHPGNKYLYAVSQLGTDGSRDAFLFSYKIDARTGNLTLLNKVSAGGGGTAHLAVDKTEELLLAANFGGGQIVAFHLNRDGSIGRQTADIQHMGKSVLPRQSSPHPHQVVIAPDNLHLIAPDMGLDKVYIYRIDPRPGTLAAVNPSFATLPAGSGPRHFAFHPSGRFGYLIDEFESAITVFAYTSAIGELKPLQTLSTLPDHFKGKKSGAEVWVDQAGRYLYAASRSDSTLLVFSIDPQQGTLTMIQRIDTQGKKPWHFAADPTGQYLFVANRDSNNVVVFRIDSGSGKLAPTGQALSVPQPTCVLFVPADKR